MGGSRDVGLGHALAGRSAGGSHGETLSPASAARAQSSAIVRSSSQSAVRAIIAIVRHHHYPGWPFQYCPWTAPSMVSLADLLAGDHGASLDRAGHAVAGERRQRLALVVQPLRFSTLQPLQPALPPDSILWRFSVGSSSFALDLFIGRPIYFILSIYFVSHASRPALKARLPLAEFLAANTRASEASCSTAVNSTPILSHLFREEEKSSDS